MELSLALRISSAPCIAFAGAGGKTTAMFQLARELTHPSSFILHPSVIVTSTTHLGAWQIPLANRHIIARGVQDISKAELRGITLITGEIENERTRPINEIALLWLREANENETIPLLIEADGSRQKPLKAPAEHEPAIPAFIRHVVYVAGLSALGKPLTEEHIHRPEIFSQLSGLRAGEAVTADSLVRVLTHPAGGLKNIPAASKRTLILNQADTAETQSAAGSVSPALLRHFDSVVVAGLREGKIHAVHENVAGIVLAAGDSKRFGKPKQLLDWRGRPFVRVIAQTALAAGLSPVIVVTGANAEGVENVVKDLDVKIIRNEEWQSGQSSSIKAGVKSLPENAGAGIFLLADQPQIGTDVIRALVESHAQGLHPILAPLVLEERRANPVLFDRVTFSDLMNLEGDVGGRAIFPKHNVEYLHWHDDRLLLDVDKPEDYQRLINDETI
jgi:molybdenum cofactor cytidylyltransferase